MIDKFCMGCGKWRPGHGFRWRTLLIRGKKYKRAECPECQTHWPAPAPQEGPRDSA